MTRQGAVLAILVLTACGGQTSSNAPDSGGPPSGHDAAVETGGGGTMPTPVTMFLTVLQAGGCLPQMLVADAQGLVRCTLYVVLPAGAGCDASAGLTTAPAAAVTAVERAGVSPSSSVCMLSQLPRSAWSNGSCVASSQPGWCYAKAPTSGECPEAILFSEGPPPVGAEVLIGCE